MLIKTTLLIFFVFSGFSFQASAKSKKQKINFLILAGGKGSRMGGQIPKTLKKLGNQTMLNRIISSCVSFDNDYKIKVLPIISEDMYNDFQNEVPDFCQKSKIGTKFKNKKCIIEKKRTGTAGAIKLAIPHLLPDSELSIILLGDAPLVGPKTIKKSIDCIKNYDACTLSFIDNSKNNFGKMILENPNSNPQEGEILALKKIIEAKDFREGEAVPSLCNSGIHIHKSKNLQKLIKKIKPWKTTGELNINDIIEIATNEKLKIGTVVVSKQEVQGANTPEEFAELEAILASQK